MLGGFGPLHSPIMEGSETSPELIASPARQPSACAMLHAVLLHGQTRGLLNRGFTHPNLPSLPPCLLAWEQRAALQQLRKDAANCRRKG